jgi:hypothetical protein
MQLSFVSACLPPFNPHSACLPAQLHGFAAANHLLIISVFDN